MAPYESDRVGHLGAQCRSLARCGQAPLQPFLPLRQLQVLLLRLSGRDDAVGDRVDQPGEGVVDLVQFGLEFLAQFALGRSTVDQTCRVVEVVGDEQAGLEKLAHEARDDPAGRRLLQGLPGAARLT